MPARSIATVPKTAGMTSSNAKFLRERWEHLNEVITLDNKFYHFLVRTDQLLPDPTNRTYFVADGER